MLTDFSRTSRTVFQSLVFIALAMGMAAISGDNALLAQPQGFNYDEAKVPKFKLPDPLIDNAGQPVVSAKDWTRRRREVMSLFQDEVYGRAPTAEVVSRIEVVEESDEALDGLAIRRQIRLHLERNGHSVPIDILLYLPKGRTTPAPTFVGLNFAGNHAVHPDPAIRLPKSWMRKNDNVVENLATEKGRGKVAHRWPIEAIVGRGFAVATIYYGDIDPDFDDGFQNGVHQLFRDTADKTWPANAWGSIAGWAWGLSRVVDCLETQPQLNAKQLMLMGHSRLGKAALWAGAREERFAIVISNDSGCGGAALSRRRFGETVSRINTSFPHWFCDNFVKYNDREDELPVDQHMLLALIAPRPVLVCSADQDRWADPHGEFLAARYADPVYRLLGTDGIARQDMPAVNEPILSTIGYHIRPGNHDVTMRDWEVYMAFADKHLAED